VIAHHKVCVKSMSAQRLMRTFRLRGYPPGQTPLTLTPIALAPAVARARELGLLAPTSRRG
jgi:hypothetical protein